MSTEQTRILITEPDAAPPVRHGYDIPSIAAAASKFIVQVGAPTAIALYYVWFTSSTLSTQVKELSEALSETQHALSRHVEQAERATLAANAAMARMVDLQWQMCMNTARTEEQRRGCGR